MKKDVVTNLRNKPINRAKYVRDTMITGSQTKAIQAQKPWMSGKQASSVAARLNKEPVVQKLKDNIELAIVDLDVKRRKKLNELMDNSESDKIVLGAVAEAGRIINDYRDRTEGKAKQTVETTSTKLEIKLDLSGGAANAEEFVESGGDDILEGEIVDE